MYQTGALDSWTLYPNKFTDSFAGFKGWILGGPDNWGHCNYHNRDDFFLNSTWLPGVGMSWRPWQTGLTTPWNNPVARPAGRFTAPAADTYAIYILFENRVPSAAATGVFVNINDAEVANQMVSGFTNTEPPVAENLARFSRNVFLNAGDTVTFGVYSIASEGFTGGGHNVAVEATFSSGGVIPAPTQELLLHLDAGAGILDAEGNPADVGDVVGTWQDQSAKNLNAYLKWGDPTLESGSFRNGSHPVIRFDGDDGLLLYDTADPNWIDPEDPNDPNGYDPLGLDTLTIYVVGKINQQQNLSQIFFANYADPTRGYGLGISDAFMDYVRFFTNGGGEMRSSGPIDDTDRYYLLAATVSQTFDKKLFINGWVDNQGTGGVQYNRNTLVTVGALDTGRQFLTGDIAEIRVYNGYVEDVHNVVVSELISKYDLDTSPLGGPDPNTVTLSALTFYGTESDGSVRHAERWNTLWSDSAWDVVLTEGDVTGLSSDPNSLFPLNLYSNMNIYAVLTKGQSYTFTWINARSDTAQGSYFGMNFFFENAEKTGASHQISVFANMTDPSEAPAPFQANSGMTMGWPLTDVFGAGTLIYKNFEKELAVTLTDWVVYHQDVFGYDLISAQVGDPVAHPLSGPDGLPDVIGQFTLQVTPYQMTCADQNEYFAMDFNQDCFVDLQDFAVFAQQWLNCNDPQTPGCTDIP